MSRYRPIDEAPKDGTPIVAVCGGVEMAVAWEGAPLNFWAYWDEEEEMPTFQKAKPQPAQWRSLF